MKRKKDEELVEIDEVKMEKDMERGNILKESIMNMRGRKEKMMIGEEKMRGIMEKMMRGVNVVKSKSIQNMEYEGQKKMKRMKKS